MKHLKSISVVTVILIVLVNSCTVKSLFPLFTENDLILNHHVLGAWDMGDSTIWTFEQAKEEKDGKKITKNYYDLTVDEKGDVAKLKAHLFTLGDYTYFNFYLEELSTENKMAIYTMLPVNTFARAEIYQDSIRISLFDPEFITGLIENKKTRIKHVITDDHLLITAPTEDIQKFVIKYQDDEDLIYDEDFSYRKQY